MIVEDPWIFPLSSIGQACETSKATLNHYLELDPSSNIG